MVKKFHDSQKDIRIEEVGFPFSDFFQRISTQLAAGRLDADALFFYDEFAMRLIKAGHLEPVDDIVTKLGVKDKLNKAYHENVTYNGKLYAMLINQTPYTLIYNRELYEKEGISKPPSTQEEYMAAAKQLTKRPNQFGHAGRTTMAEQNGWFWDLTHWVLGYGGAWAEGKKPLVTEPPVINAVKAYKRLYEDAIPRGATASDYRRMAWEGKVAQYIDNSTNIGILALGNPNILPKIFSAPPPWPNRKAMSVSTHVGIYSGSKNKEAAKTWWEFVFQRENIQEFLESGRDVIAPYEGSIREEYLKGLHWSSGFVASQGVVLPTIMGSFQDNVAEFRQIVLGKVSEVLVANKAPEQAMAEAQKELEALAARLA
jgi:multiple sugar transport system substrate-binding protein